MLCNVCVLSFSADPATTTPRLAELLGISEAEATQLVESVPVVLKRNIEPHAARDIERQLREIGAEVVVQASASGVAPGQGSPRGAPQQGPTAPSMGQTRSAQPASSSQPGGKRRPRWVASAAAVVVVGAVVAAVLFFSSRSTRPASQLALNTRGGGEAGDPVLILLHGYRAPGKDMVALGEEILRLEPMPNVRVIAPEGVLSKGEGRYAWFDSTQQLAEARKQVSALIDELIDEGTPPQRIILGGFSQGATLAVDVGLRHRPRIFGVAMLSGGYIRGVDWTPVLKDLGGTRFLVTHGRQDRVMPFQSAMAIADQLNVAGARVSWVPFDGGHGIPSNVRGELARFCSAIATSD